MSYATLMVHLQIGRPNDNVLAITRLLAVTHQAAVIGIAASETSDNFTNEDYYLVAQSLDEGIASWQAHLAAAEAEFRDALQGCAEISWRTINARQSITETLAQEARGTDLLIVCADQPLDPPYQIQPFNLGELVVHAGRPVLGVPKSGIASPAFDRGIIYWKDTLETRRAVVDALPLLKKASSVLLVQVAEKEKMTAEGARMEAVTFWLERHGIKVDLMVVEATSSDAEALRAITSEHKPDFGVAGLYSHNRLRERVFGGVSRDLLRLVNRCVLLSH
ncbi:universal stress protein UspA [Acidocella aquatica]|uniref:Universal stress protein UspA n=1 Tax=Acidocella aquatica TaxID=1922313 RepID=A0ABQ6AG93_9PROT|nr:universal stress protein [Acidocella aquatica]GLR69035.1 universal stress protein UspA [Acidocella aquatica]